MKKPTIAFLIALAVTTLPAGALRAQDLGIEVGKRAPSAIVRTLDGKAVDLGSYVGKTPIFMEFWAVWCPNCRELEPSLLSLQKKYGSKVRFLSVAVSVNETIDRVKTFTAKKKYPHQTVYDAKGEATEAYDVPATSYVVIVDRAGKVVYTGLGGKQNLEPGILKALR